MIKFRRLKVEGFGSIREAEFEFRDNGITLIKGNNGTGKSSLINPIVWVLYGNLLKSNSSVETWEHKRLPDYKGLKIELTLEDKEGKEHTITRCKNYSGKVDGAKGMNRLILSSSNKNKTKEVQDDILDILNNMPLELFSQSIIFGQKVKSLVEEKGASRKKLLEHCLNFDMIQEAIEKIKTENGHITNLYDKTYNGYTKSLSELEILLHQIENVDIKYKSKLELYEKQVELYNKSIKNLSKKPESVKPLIKEIESLNKSLSNISLEEIDRYTKELNQLKKDLSDKNLELAKSIHSDKKQIDEYSKGFVCDICGQDTTKFNKDKVKTLKKNVDTLMNQQAEIVNQINNNQLQLDKLLNKKVEYNSIERKIKDLEAEVKSKSFDNSDEIKRINEELKLLVKPEKPDKIVLLETKENLKKDIKIVEKTLKKLKRKQKINEWLLKEPLSNKGLKSYLFDNLLMGKINKYISNYTFDMPFDILFKVDHESGNKDVVIEILQQWGEEQAMPVMYDDLSGGQKQIINVITLLAIHDLVAEVNPFNCMILDEIFESLDSNNIELVSSLLEKKARNYEVFIITHHLGFNPTNVKVINTILDENGLTKIV
jgi:DNA repair exonuclease SbcCD ATPase subunit